MKHKDQKNMIFQISPESPVDIFWCELLHFCKSDFTCFNSYCGTLTDFLFLTSENSPVQSQLPWERELIALSADEREESGLATKWVKL